MTMLAELIKSAPKNSVIIGDFNLPGACWDTGTSKASERVVVEAVEDKLMTQLVDFSTHIKGNVLDLVVTDMPERVLEVREEGRLGKSDHSIIVAEINVTTGSEKKNDARQDWRNADWEKMRNMLAEQKWKADIRGADTEEAWRIFQEKISEVTVECVPARRRRNVNRPPWMTQEILRAIRKKKRMWAKVKASPDKEEYKKQEKLTRNLIRNAKRRFERKLADGGGQNKKPFYAYVKTKTKARQSIGPLKTKNGETVTENATMAELLNETFGAAFTREETGSVPEPADQHHGEKLTGVRVTVKEVKQKLKGLRREAAAGPDKIGPGLLYELREELAPTLAVIFNKSLASGVVPKEWKEANVTPIFKKGSKAAPENYRPVSLTSVCFFEKATRTVDNGEAFDAVFLDFAKAFDKVPHARLLKKLKAKGIDGQLLNWIKNWLCGRRQRVALGGEFSTWIEVLSGVPQGSVLGPLLFLIFIDDIDEAAAAVDIIRKFADDTKVGHTVNNEDDRRKLQEAIDNLVSWSKKWGMQFNVKKCKVVHFGRSNQCYEYSMDGDKLEVSEEERDIGIEIHQSLKPTKQCAKAAATARSVLGQISRSFHYRDRKTFVKLYITYVRPHLEFSTPAWSPWSLGDIKTLEKVQEKFVNMLSGLAGKT
jgi:Reverse transcriptase (RNA-dependent DNA polymerase)/Endonuclease-reverse transcriptase